MKSINRELSVSCKMANLAILDIVEGREKGVVKQNDGGKYHFRIEVYGNPCGFAAHTMPVPNGCVLTIALTEPAVGLSDEGQGRALQYLLDSVEQLMENENAHYENGMAGKGE